MAVNAKSENVVEMSTPKEPRRLTVQERVIAVTAEVGVVSASSVTQQGKAAIGIGDVEEALAPLLAKYGLVTRWSSLGLESFKTPTSTQKGEMREWLTHLRVIVQAADDPEDRFEDEWRDTGSNPMAASSFARKGYYKALFHITEPDDEGAPAGTTRTSPATQAAKPKWRNVPIPGRGCPECGGGLAAIYGDKGGFIGHVERGSECRWKPDASQRTQLLAQAPDPSPQTQAPPAVFDYIGHLKLLDEATRRAVHTDRRFARNEGESAVDWIARLTPAQKADLRIVLDAKSSEVPVG